MNNIATETGVLHKYCGILQDRNLAAQCARPANYALKGKLQAKKLPKSIFFADE